MTTQSTDTIGQNDPDNERAQFLGKHRQAAENSGARRTCTTLDQTALDALDIHQGFSWEVGIFSIGNPHEAHGPALAQDIDDRTATAVSVAVANVTGARYLGHIPICTDGIGDLAETWSPAYQPEACFVNDLITFADMLLRWTHDRAGRPRPKLIWFVSGHGGNNVLEHHLGRVALALGVARCCYTLSIRTDGADFTPTRVQHAGTLEHALAAHLGPGCLDDGRMPNIHEASDAELYNLLSSYPAWAGMAGFYLFGDPRYNAVRERYSGVKRAVSDLLEHKELSADPNLGARIFKHSNAYIAEALRTSAQVLKIALPPHLDAPVSLPTADIQAALFTLADSEGRILLQHRTDDAKVLPGYLGFFGGGIEQGESPEQALHREAYEELGITLPTMTALGIRYHRHHTGRLQESHLFLGTLHIPLDVLRKQQQEGQGLEMVFKHELQHKKIPEHDWDGHALIFSVLHRSQNGLLNQNAQSG